MKLLLYCTKAKPMLKVAREDLFKHQDRARCYKQWEIKYFTQYVSEEMYEGNGKIVAECDFEVEDLRIVDDDPLGAYWYETKTLSENEVLEKSCLTGDELFDYLGEDNEGYAIHIKNLHIFDKPRELYDCLIHPKIEPKYYGCEHLSKAPQNMMYVELDDIKYVLISIQPQWLCKILNGEKTIEVRKKVLKEMLE